MQPHAIIVGMSPCVTAGVDEVGRGALAGPVVAAACIFERRQWRLPRGVRIEDSKKLDPAQREEAYRFLTARFPFGVGIVEASVVDRQGILTATELAMQRAVAALRRVREPTYLLVDGRDKFWFDLPHSSIIDGDRLEPCISAASIIAKVLRDRLMVRSDRVFPGYGFAQHKGYGTDLHQRALKKLSPCSIHRLSFLPIKGPPERNSRFGRGTIVRGACIPAANS